MEASERPARTRRRRHVLRLAALSGIAVALLDGSVAWTSAASVPKRTARIARHAKKDLNYEKLREEGNAMADFMNGFSSLFSNKPSEEEIEERKAEMVVRLKENEEQLDRFRGFKLGTVVGAEADGSPKRQAIPTEVLLGDAGQSVVVFAAADPKALQDTLLSIRLEAKTFSERNVLVVPVLFDSAMRTFAPFPKALMAQKTMSLPFVAVPAVDDTAAAAEWGAFLAVEFAAAAKQGVGEQAESEGLSLLLAASGEVVRRGLGFPIWEDVFRDLQAAAKKAAKEATAARAEASRQANVPGGRIV